MPSPLRLLPHLCVQALLISAPTAGFTATVGSPQSVDFGSTVINSTCTLAATGGSVGVRTNRTLITSSAAEGGNFTGNLAPASISALSNLTSTGFVTVDTPRLSGPTAATTSEVKIDGGTWGSSAKVNLGTEGDLAATPVHVRFTTTSNNSRFTPGNYAASATVTCSDS